MIPNYSMLPREQLLLVARGLWAQIEELTREVERLRDGYGDWTPGMKLEPGDKVMIMGEVVMVEGPSRIKTVWEKSRTVRSWLWKWAKISIVGFLAYIIPYASGALIDGIDVNGLHCFPVFMFLGGAVYEMYLNRAMSRKG